MNERRQRTPNTQAINPLTFLVCVGIPPAISGALLVAASILGWQNRNLPAFIHLPPPIGDMRLALFNEPISWILACFLSCCGILCIICIVGAVFSKVASSTKHRRIAAGIAVGSLGSLLFAVWMLGVF